MSPRNRPRKLDRFIFIRNGDKTEIIIPPEDQEIFDAIIALLELGDEEPALQEGFQPNGFPAFIWPSTYEPKTVTQPFGVNEEYYGRFNLPGHEGIDMRAPAGQEIIAVWDGEVARVEFHQAYGNSIRLHHHIEFPGGKIVHYETIYAHFVNPSELRVGDTVREGAVLGYADSTGNSSGHHLHFGVKQFNHPELKPPVEKEFPYDLIDCTVFFEWLKV